MEKKVRQSAFDKFKDYVFRFQERTNVELASVKAAVHERRLDAIMSLEKRIDKLNETIAKQEEKINDLKNALENERVAINNPPRYRRGDVVAGYKILSIKHKPGFSLLPSFMTITNTTSWIYCVKDKNGVESEISEGKLESVLWEEKKNKK